MWLLKESFPTIESPRYFVSPDIVTSLFISVKRDFLSQTDSGCLIGFQTQFFSSSPPKFRYLCALLTVSRLNLAKSSAKLTLGNKNYWSRIWFRGIRKNNGPRGKPWGTPTSINYNPENVPFSFCSFMSTRQIIFQKIKTSTSHSIVMMFFE